MFFFYFSPEVFIMLQMIYLINGVYMHHQDRAKIRRFDKIDILYISIVQIRITIKRNFSKPKENTLLSSFSL